MQTSVKSSRRRLSPQERQEFCRESLSRAVSNQSVLNYETIIREFSQRGIPVDQIIPRENVFTFHAWKALGRFVRKGEHGVKVVSWVPIAAKDSDVGQVDKSKRTAMRPVSATVFHISQTDVATEGGAK